VFDFTFLLSTMDSIIEVQRQTHEEIERFERVLYTLLSKHQPTHEDKVRSEHKASQILDRASSRISALNNLYEDDDARKAEVNALSTPAQQNDLSEFYSRLVKIQEHHSKYPDSVPGGFELELEALLEDGEPDGEEEYEGDDRAYPFYRPAD
jgi:splicing factor 3A subunit 3